MNRSDGHGIGERQPDVEAPLDCVIIGGGPAGLTAAIYCARYLLSTTVIDAGEGRARLIPRTHNHAGFPGGIAGSELVERIRAQAIENGAKLRGGRVDAVRRSVKGFEIGCGAETLRARTLLLATGITDRRPAMSNACHDAALAAGAIRYCPICDGYEAIDKQIAVIGTGEHGVREAVFLRAFSKTISLVAPDGSHRLSERDRAETVQLGIALIDGPARNFTLEPSGLALDTGNGRLSFETVYPALGAVIHSELAVALGARVRGGGCLIVDDHARTSVSGLYAAGDVVLGLDQLSGAMGQAALAATTIRNDLAQQARRIR